MKLFVLFGQRIQRYDGEYLPEPLEVADQETADVNPDWMYEKHDYHGARGDFEKVEWVEVDLGSAERALMERFQGVLEIEGEVS